MLKPVLLSGLVGLSIVSFAIAPNAQAQGITYQAQIQSAASQTIPALELQQFVQVQKRWKGIEQQSQGLMVQAIKSEGLTPERFVAILKQKQSPTPSDEPLSSDDNTKFEKINPILLPTPPEGVSRPVLRIDDILYPSSSDPC